ncbi:Uncharacterised protein [uncultured archaeon]|nr:Uncharacterised protein [uncultured archaeon]
MLFSKFDRILIIFVIIIFGTIAAFSINVDQTRPYHDARQMAIGTESIMSDINTLLPKYGGTGIAKCMATGMTIKWNSGTNSWYCDVDNTGVTGNGSMFYLTKWSGSSSIGASLIFDNGTSVGVGTTIPLEKFQVSTGNNSNLAIGSGVGGATTISAYNNTATANTPLEIRASQTTFTQGNVRAIGDICTDAGGGKCLSTSGGTKAHIRQTAGLSSGGSCSNRCAAIGGEAIVTILCSNNGTAYNPVLNLDPTCVVCQCLVNE